MSTRGTAAILPFVLLAQAGRAWFDLPPGPDVVEVRNTQDNQFCWYAGPGNPQEWTVNKGGSTPLRLKGWQDVTALGFDLSSFRGRRVAAAELHLARANADPVSALVAATIVSEWRENDACWRFRAPPDAPWTFPQSDFSSATFGNHGSRVCFAFRASDTFRAYTREGRPWIAMVLDPALVQALILDAYGLAVTDPRWHVSPGGNPTVFSREQNAAVQPRLLLRFAPDRDTTPPGAAGRLAVAPGEEDGSAVLRFAAPVDPDDGAAFGYRIRLVPDGAAGGGTDLPRWRLPRPGRPGTEQRVLVEDLPPGVTVSFAVQAYDAAGNEGPPVRVRYAIPPPRSLPAMADGGLAAPDTAGKSVRNVPGVMRWFAAAETARISPATGNRVEDGYGGPTSDDYRKANTVWDADRNVISLRACRNEVVGVQIVLQRLAATLDSVRVSVGDLRGPGGARIPAAPNAGLFRLHYVRSGSHLYPEAAIPLAAPFPGTFDIPDRDHNPDGAYQSVWLDLYVPPESAPGVYTGTVTVAAPALKHGASGVEIGLTLRVSPVAIPDAPTFTIDLNGYGNPWDFGPDPRETCLRYFHAAHKHRAVLNTLPYGWNGSVRPDRGPALTGNGATRHAASWDAFDAQYDRFFATQPSRSAFNRDHGYEGPGANTPVAHFYTPFHEMWPQSMLDRECGFDAAGRGAAWWDGLRTAPSGHAELFAACPDVRAAFPEGYCQAHRNVMADWLAHARERGWTRTAFETYLNHKYTYRGTHALWVLEECESADDFRAVGFFHQLWREGRAASAAPTAPWHFRIDISDRWGQHYGELDNRVNWFVMGSSAAGWHWPEKKYRDVERPAGEAEEWTWYGLGAPVAGSGLANARTLLQKWCQGFDGGLPYWDCFHTRWAEADDATPCIVYSGENVPGSGLYAGPLVSQRLKQLRQAQQIIELLNLWASCPDMNRSRVRQALQARYGERTRDFGFGNLDEPALHRLRADLTAQLESIQPLPAGHCERDR